MKKKIIFIVGMLCFCSMYLLTGCQKVPSEVTERMKEYGANEEKEAVDMHYIKVSTLDALEVDTSSIKTDNMILPEKVSFHGIKEISNLDCRYIKGHTDNRDELVQMFFGTQVSWEKYVDEENKDYIFYEINNLEKRLYMGVRDNGFTSLLREDIYDVNFNSSFSKPDRVVRLEQESGKPEVLVDLGGQKLDALDESKYVVKWLEENWNPYDGAFSFQPKTLVVRPCGEHEMLSMFFERAYKGVPLSSYTDILGEVDGKTIDMRTSAGINFAMTVHGRIDCFTNETGILDIAGEENIVDIIDLESAVRLAEQEISGFKKMEIADVRIIYDLYNEYDYKKEHSMADSPGNKVIAKPAYSFVINTETKEESVFVNENEMYSYINVDAVDGSVTYNLDNIKYSGE